MFSKLTNRLAKIPYRVYLVLGVTIFALANPVTSKLAAIGAANPVDGRNPISFCNVLFVGNLCALCTLLVIYFPELKLRRMGALSRKSWINLVIVAILSGVVAPALIFRALEITNVNNVILIGRIEPPLALVLAVIFLQARVNPWIVAGALLSFLGVIVTILGSNPENMMGLVGLEVGRGELMTGIGAIAAAIAGIISKVSLQQVPLGLFNVIRTAIATVFFFITAIYLFGSEHFQDVFSPLLWRWMLFYGVVIVVLGQLSWFAGVKKATAAEISLANSFNPIAGIIGTYLILQEVPSLAQYLGGLIILVGIVINQIGISRQNHTSVAEKAQNALAMEGENGFRGV